MKKIKKIMAMLLAMVMVLGMTVTASAAGNNKITVIGADEATLKYVQVVVEDRTSTNGWKFVDGTIETTFVNAWKKVDNTNNDADKVIKALIGMGKLENPNNVNATTGTINSSAAFGEALDAIAKNGDIAKNELNENANTSAKGLYVVIAEKTGFTYMPMAAYIDVDGTPVEITAKGSENQVKKEVTAQTHVSKDGDVLDYKVTANYPFFPANAQTKTFKITDTITNAEFVKESVKVMVGTVNVTEEFVPTFDDLQENSGEKKTTQTMTIDFTNKYNPEYAGKTVVVTYKAKVVDPFNVGDVVVSNNAKCDVDDKYTTATVVNDFAKFTITKTNDYKNENEKVTLPGATFTLYEAVSQETDGAVEKAYNKSIVYVKAVDEATTDENGQVTFYGLDPDRTYYVEEKEAPNGYVKLDTLWMLDGATKKTETEIVSHDGYTEQKTTVTVTDYTPRDIKNTKLSSLPSTGGIGTTIFTIGGCAIMVAAAGLFFASRRKANK